MTARQPYPDYLGDVLDAAEKAQEFVSGMGFTDFLADDRTKFAVIRCLEIIGEATRQTPADVLNRYPDVSWREVVGMRNHLAHNFRNIDMAVVWEVLHRDLPHLLSVLENDPG